jgi:hypothetical protein
MPYRANLPYRLLYAAMTGDATACWNWPGATNPQGYGCLRIEGRPTSAHRWAYTLLTGETIPSHLVACHRCDNPGCVNPAHIFVGTKRDNTQDMLVKGRGRNPLFAAMRAKTHCPKGHEYTPENTTLKRRARSKGARVYRQCRECYRASRRVK